MIQTRRKPLKVLKKKPLSQSNQQLNQLLSHQQKKLLELKKQLKKVIQVRLPLKTEQSLMKDFPLNQLKANQQKKQPQRQQKEQQRRLQQNQQ